MKKTDENKGGYEGWEHKGDPYSFTAPWWLYPAGIIWLVLIVIGLISTVLK